MKKINENQKITLTIGQLKRLIKESDDNRRWAIVNKDGEYLGYAGDGFPDYVLWSFDSLKFRLKNVIKFRSKERAEAYIAGEHSVDFPLDAKGLTVVECPVKVDFKAAGAYKSRKIYKGRSEVERDAAEIAADHNGEVEDWGNEIYVTDESGDTIATWEIIL